MLKRRVSQSSIALAAIPYLLLSSSQEAGLVTHLQPDGSGERVVYARTAPDRTGEVERYLEAAVPGGALSGRDKEAEPSLSWRDVQLSDLASVADSQLTTTGVFQAPLSLYTAHVWKETVKFDRGAATEAEMHGQGMLRLKYVVRMPGEITSQSPPAKVEGSRVEWDLNVGPEPQVITVESRTFRWPCLLVWLWILAFVIAQLAAWGPKVAKRIPRKPPKI